MVLMALDHFVYFINRFHPAEFWITSPPDFPSPAYAIFRLLSHLCAPGFVLLAGTGLVLFAAGRSSDAWTNARIRKSLIVRGVILLVVVQFVLEQIAWALGDLGGRGIALNAVDVPGIAASGPYGYLGVIYVLAICTILGSLLFRLPKRILAVVAGLSLVASPIVLSFVDSALVTINPIMNALFVPGVSVLFTNYPLFPWLGVFLIGILLGRQIMERGRVVLDRSWLPGVVALLLGVAVRLLQPWGEAHRFNPGRLGSFLELSKYPPSLAFIGITLGILGLLLWVFHRLETASLIHRIAGLLQVFGREPLFFYILHLFFYGALCFVFVLDTSPVLTLIGWLISLGVFAPVLWWFHNVKAAGKIPGFLRWL
jgi:uncharacterized membrane protein